MMDHLEAWKQVAPFITYQNSAVDLPGISLKWQGNLLGEKTMPFSALLSDPEYFPVVVKLDSDATADVWFNNEVIFYDVPVPGFSSVSGANFVWAARTGGLNENAFIDNINLTTNSWQPVAGASSPYSIPMPSSGRLYFRAAR